jgi:phenylacetate-CoA ligase
MRNGVPKFLSALRTRPESHWLKRGEKTVLKLFHETASRVPAYRDFLKKNRIDPAKIKTVADFKNVPPTSKKDYLRAYPLPMLSWDGKLVEKRSVYSATSGSTGEPFYFPRTDAQDRQYAFSAEMYLRNNFGIQKGTTLYVDGFAMGVWIGGLFTYQAVKILADRGEYPLSIITPGVNKKEILKAVKRLGGLYDRVILGGYPPFIKDVVDEGPGAGIRWKDYDLKFVFSAEGFNEDFRDYIFKKAGLKDIYADTLNHYGTVDLGTMSHETPLSILVRRIAVKERKIYGSIFPGATKLPTLTQFLPELFYFEEQNGGLFCSARSGLPLVRYDLKDRGGVITLGEMNERFSKEKMSLKGESARAKITEKVWNLPFVHVYERDDFAVVLSGANVYPEEIREALQKKRFERHLTSKFTMIIKNDKRQNPRLEINVELKPNGRSSKGLAKEIEETVVKTLLERNSEYASNYRDSPARSTPEIIFWPYEHETHFGPGGKQKWVKK